MAEYYLRIELNPRSMMIIAGSLIAAYMLNTLVEKISPLSALAIASTYCFPLFVVHTFVFWPAFAAVSLHVLCLFDNYGMNFPTMATVLVAAGMCVFWQRYVPTFQRIRHFLMEGVGWEAVDELFEP